MLFFFVAFIVRHQATLHEVRVATDQTKLTIDCVCDSSLSKKFLVPSPILLNRLDSADPLTPETKHSVNITRVDH
jgi:hypothetical protein